MAIPLRADFDARMVRELPRGDRRRGWASGQAAFLALAAIYDGASRTRAAKIGGGDAPDRSRLE